MLRERIYHKATGAENRPGGNNPYPLEEIRSRLDIVDVIQSYVRLEKRGRNYVGLCPLHREKTPSFTVSPEKQIFYCFGCQRGGDVFRFLMYIEGIDFGEAVRRLAAQAGVNLEKSSEDRKKVRLMDILRRAADFFRNNLLQAEEAAAARNYLNRRGVEPSWQEKFALGYALPEWDALTRELKRQGVADAELREVGLVVEGNGGRVYDRFRDRLIFPIHDALGVVVGFGGRVLDDSGQPKYLNSPESRFFSKRRLLYGLYQARTAIKESGYAVLMEGYMDVITSHQFGVRNAVAALGTALTPEHCRLLQRYTSTVYLCYDTDSAGRQAAERNCDQLLSAGFTVRVINLPSGKDPDEYWRSSKRPEWEEVLAGAETVVEFKLRCARERGLTSAGAVKSVLPVVAALGSAVEQEESLKLIAVRTGVSLGTVWREWQRYCELEGRNRVNPDKIANKTHTIVADFTAPEQRGRMMVEREILRFAFGSPARSAKLANLLSSDDFIQPLYRQLFTRVVAGGELPAEVMTGLNEEEQALVAQLLMTEEDIACSGEEESKEEKEERWLKSLIQRLRHYQCRQERRQLLAELGEAERAGLKDKVQVLLQRLAQIDAGKGE